MEDEPKVDATEEDEELASILAATVTTSASAAAAGEGASVVGDSSNDSSVDPFQTPLRSSGLVREPLPVVVPRPSSPATSSATCSPVQGEDDCSPPPIPEVPPVRLGWPKSHAEQGHEEGFTFEEWESIEHSKAYAEYDQRIATHDLESELRRGRQPELVTLKAQVETQTRINEIVECFAAIERQEYLRKPTNRQLPIYHRKDGIKHANTLRLAFIQHQKHTVVRHRLKRKSHNYMQKQMRQNMLEEERQQQQLHEQQRNKQEQQVEQQLEEKQQLEAHPPLQQQQRKFAVASVIVDEEVAPSLQAAGRDLGLAASGVTSAPSTASSAPDGCVAHLLEARAELDRETEGVTQLMGLPGDEQAESQELTRQRGDCRLVSKPLSIADEDVAEDVAPNLPASPPACGDASTPWASDAIAPLGSPTPCPLLSALPTSPLALRAASSSPPKTISAAICTLAGKAAAAASAHAEALPPPEPAPDVSAPLFSRVFSPWLRYEVERRGTYDSGVSAALESEPALVECAALWEKYDACEAWIAGVTDEARARWLADIAHWGAPKRDETHRTLEAKMREMSEELLQTKKHVGPVSEEIAKFVKWQASEHQAPTVSKRAYAELYGEHCHRLAVQALLLARLTHHESAQRAAELVIGMIEQIQAEDSSATAVTSGGPCPPGRGAKRCRDEETFPGECTQAASRRRIC
eukprot:GHVT01040721.1.p1 GENE.GHVT01040721.1~~GHVT01040721.1.p1  ORF type:complete len:762 (+),score=196.75 GHVT01040721.1:202-2286(+)